MKQLENMTLYEASRWAALLCAIDVIDEKCEKLNKNFNKIEISPVELKKYIANTFETHYINLGHYLEKNGVFLSKERPDSNQVNTYVEQEDKEDILL